MSEQDKSITGFVSYWITPDGHHFLSDAHPTLAECKAAYNGAEITGYIDLSKIPEEAFHDL